MDTTRLKPSLAKAIKQQFRSAKITQRNHHRLSVFADGLFEVRPYHIRKGDTLQTIASKRELDVKEITKLNHDLDEKSIVAGNTILLPAGKLSARDKQIIKGIGTFSYRLYPVRKGEKIKAIMEPRGIKLEELEKLNPGVNLDRLKANQVIKLPARKYTLREREVLIGNNVLPPEFFSEKSKTFGVGIAVALAVAGAVFWWQRDYAKKHGWLEDDE